MQEIISKYLSQSKDYLPLQHYSIPKDCLPGNRPPGQGKQKMRRTRATGPRTSTRDPRTSPLGSTFPLFLEQWQQ